MTKSIILLSGGLDSLVSLALVKEKYNISLALTFDYGQKSVKQEVKACQKICRYYKIEHKIIKLNWLKEITHTALVNSSPIPEGIQKNSNSVWVPNRNGLFLNIAASLADGEGFDYIVIGANKEEAQIFPDNTGVFIDKINAEFKYSTKRKPKVVAPLINFNKNDIVKQAIQCLVPLELVWSCYGGAEKHCGLCESCTRFKNALTANNDTKYINLIFQDEDVINR